MDNLELWYRANIKQITISEQPPITFKANGEPLADWTICGAQGGVGERTDNLFYKQIPSANISANGVVVSVTGYNLNIAAVTAGKTYSYSNFVGGGVYGFFSDEPAIGSTTYNSSRQLLSVEYGQIAIPAGTNYVAFRSPSATENLMLNQGGTVSPYEPYGYKIPIICGGETTNIYLDKPLKMVGDETEYVNYATQKQHRVRKNLLQNMATSQAINGVEVTVNSDKSISLSFDSVPFTRWVTINSNVSVKDGYILSGCPNLGINGLALRATSTNNTQNYVSDAGTGVLIDDTIGEYANILIRVPSGYASSNLTFYPMIRKSDIEDDTYEPYIEDTELDVTLPALPTLSGTNTLTVNTTVQPSSVSVTSPGAVPEGLRKYLQCKYDVQRGSAN